MPVMGDSYFPVKVREAISGREYVVKDIKGLPHGVPYFIVETAVKEEVKGEGDKGGEKTSG